MAPDGIASPRNDVGGSRVDAVATHPETGGVGSTGGAGGPMLLEPGGTGPAPVFAGAGLDRAAAAAVGGAFSNAGRIRAAAGHGPAHRSVVAPPAARIAGRARASVRSGGVGSTAVHGATRPRHRPFGFREGDEHGLRPDRPVACSAAAPRATGLIRDGLAGLGLTARPRVAA